MNSIYYTGKDSKYGWFRKDRDTQFNSVLFKPIQTLSIKLKPIFHCVGVGVGQCPRRQNFALGIPTCWYFGANANPLICVLADAKPEICILADAKPKRKPVEYRLRWVPTQNSGVGHVHFMFFVLISFALGSQHAPSFQWNMGL